MSSILVGDVEAARELLAGGADPALRMNDGRTAADLVEHAPEQAQAELRKLLAAAGAVLPRVEGVPVPRWSVPVFEGAKHGPPPKAI